MAGVQGSCDFVAVKNTIFPMKHRDRTTDQVCEEEAYISDWDSQLPILLGNHRLPTGCLPPMHQPSPHDVKVASGLLVHSKLLCIPLVAFSIQHLPLYMQKVHSKHRDQSQSLLYELSTVPCSGTWTCSFSWVPAANLGPAVTRILFSPTLVVFHVSYISLGLDAAR